jgi:hypothetical protein
MPETVGHSMEDMNMSVKVFNPGDRVRLKASFLRSTGQYSGHDAHAIWTVQACKVYAGGRTALVLTDEERPDDGTFTPEEIAADPTLKYRRINAANLERCR